MTAADIRDLSEALFWLSFISGFLGAFTAVIVVDLLLDFTRSRREVE